MSGWEAALLAEELMSKGKASDSVSIVWVIIIVIVTGLIVVWFLCKR